MNPFSLKTADEFWDAYTSTRKDQKKVRVLGRKVLMGLHQTEEKSRGGRIWLPPSAAGVYGGPPHLKKLKATVLAAGADCKHVKPGDVVVVVRQFFARWVRLENGQFVGHCDETQIVGFPKPVDTYIE